MAKYYVQSGTLRCVVAAESPRGAALWAVQRAMQQILPVDPAASGAAAEDDATAGSTVIVLSGTIRVSERGYDGADTAALPTLEVVTEWNQMVNTLDRLENLL